MFEHGAFTLHSASKSNFRIDCTSLTWFDYESLAAMVAPRLKPFGQVYGIPRGGLRFARALERYETIGPRLVVDDVLTTGTSMEAERMYRDQGVVIFSRTKNVPDWIHAIFTAELA
jgi:hypoxanthine phosphoribosyltransferase